MKIAVVGTGYVGLVTGTCLAEVGHEVTCVDVDEDKIKKLRSGIAPIFEPGLDPLIARNVQHERLHFTTILKDAMVDSTVLFIAVGTPEKEDGSADLKHVLNVARSIGDIATRSLLVIVKSTVPVGTCDEVERVIKARLTDRGMESKIQIEVASNPEFLKEGVAIADCMRPDRIVVGLQNVNAQKTFWDLYGTFIRDDPGRMLFMDRRSSELTKYGANAMLATRISFMNELSRLCEKVGADIENVRTGMGSDGRIGKKFLYAGPGYGGSCFPKDVSALLQTGSDCNQKMSVLQAVSDANVAQKEYVTAKIFKQFNSDVKGKRFAIWGLSFKPGTDDVRESPAAHLIRRLVESGAVICAHDPKAIETFAALFGKHSRVSYAENPYAATQNADALILMTEWSEYKHPNWEKIKKSMSQKIIFDFRNQYSFKALAEEGFTYHGVGRPDSTSKK